MIKLKHPENNSVICIATQKQLEYLNMDRRNLQGDSIDWLNLERRAKDDDTFPLSVKFVWECDRIASLVISETEDFEDFRIVRGDKTCTVINLKAGTRYFWKVKCGNEESDVFFFETENILPRWIYVDGLTNVRDCGGWMTDSGKKVKQGLLYRGSELNSHVTITDSGLKTMREDLKIKTVLDIRGSTEIVKDIYKGGYVNIPVKAYGDYIDEPEQNRKIFEFLSDETNYPVYFHCWGGADRTGTIAFLLNAFLGVGEKDLIDDYEITTLSIWGVRSRNTDLFRSLIEKIDEFKGETLKQKVENFMLESGVTKEQIESIRRIFL